MSALLVPRNTLPATTFDFCTLVLTTQTKDEPGDLCRRESIYETLEMLCDDDASWGADAFLQEDRPFFHWIEMR